MSYEQFLKEKTKIDELLQQGYSIERVVENLDGAFLQLVRKERDGKTKTQTLHVQSADARKYFSVRVIQQLNSA